MSSLQFVNVVSGYPAQVDVLSDQKAQQGANAHITIRKRSEYVTLSLAKADLQALADALIQAADDLPDEPDFIDGDLVALNGDRAELRVLRHGDQGFGFYDVANPEHLRCPYDGFIDNYVKVGSVRG